MEIAVIGDHPVFSEALQVLLMSVDPSDRPSLFGTVEDCVNRVRDGWRPSLTWLDLTLPGYRGVRALACFRESAPGVPAVVFSGEDHVRLMRDCLELGAMGFVPKTIPRLQRVAAIQLGLGGGYYIPRELLLSSDEASDRAAPSDTAGPPTSASSADAPPDDEDVDPALAGLTPRQRDVMRELLRGAPNKIICDRLQLSENTAKNHVTAIFRALGVKNRTQAVIKASRLGLRHDLADHGNGQRSGGHDA